MKELKESIKKFAEYEYPLLKDKFDLMRSYSQQLTGRINHINCTEIVLLDTSCTNFANNPLPVEIC